VWALNLTDGAEDRTLKWILGQSTTAPTLPFKVALMTVNGDDATPGTEVVGGSYARQTLTAAAVVSGASSNTVELAFAGMPACTVVGVEIYDSAGSPFRWWWGAVTAQKTYAAADTARLAIGALALTLG
jgi:hypothetical protein